MLQLIYTSVASVPMTQGLIDDICDQARENNRRDEITGILVTRGSRFLQALEGPRAVVEDTFIRIIVDPRHHDLDLLTRRLIGHREFGGWEMRHCPTAEHCPDVFDKIGTMLEEAPGKARIGLSRFLTVST